MRAWFAKPEPARFHLTNPKLLAHEMIQWDSAGNKIAPAVADTIINIELAFHCFDRLGFDQSQPAFKACNFDAITQLDVGLSLDSVLNELNAEHHPHAANIADAFMLTH